MVWNWELCNRPARLQIDNILTEYGVAIVIATKSRTRTSSRTAHQNRNSVNCAILLWENVRIAWL